jgi:hypothetical protein
VEGFAEKDFVICVWAEVTYIEKFTGRSDRTLTSEVKIGTVFAWKYCGYI